MAPSAVRSRRRLADAGLAADEHERRGHEPAAEHAVELGDAGRDPVRLLGLRRRRAGGAARRSAARRHRAAAAPRRPSSRTPRSRGSGRASGRWRCRTRCRRAGRPPPSPWAWNCTPHLRRHVCRKSGQSSADEATDASGTATSRSRRSASARGSPTAAASRTTRREPASTRPSRSASTSSTPRTSTRAGRAETFLGERCSRDARATRTCWRPSSTSRWTTRAITRGSRATQVAQADRRLARAAPHRPRRPLPVPPLRPRDAARGDDGGADRGRARPARRGTSASANGAPSRSRPSLDLSREHGYVKFVSSQPQYSLLWREPEREVIPLCAANGISQIVWSPLAQGVLTGKYRAGPAAARGLARGERADGPDDGRAT